MKWIFLFFAVVSSQLWAQTPPKLEIQLDGQVIAGPVNLASLPVLDVEAYSAPLKTSEGYRGFSFLEMARIAIPQDLARVLEIQLQSENGYSVYYPMEMFQKTQALMAFTRKDGGPFVRYSGLQKQLITLAPYYLVWNARALSPNEQAIYNHIYKIKTVNFITRAVNLGVNLQEVDANIQLGQRTYKQFCLSCHALQSEGGKVSINFLENKTIALKGRDYFVKYALDPAKVNPRTAMPELPQFKNREGMAQAVVDFLLFMEKPEAFYKDKKITPLQERYKKLTRMLQEARAKAKP